MYSVIKLNVVPSVIQLSAFGILRNFYVIYTYDDVRCSGHECQWRRANCTRWGDTAKVCTTSSKHEADVANRVVNLVWSVLCSAVSVTGNTENMKSGSECSYLLAQSGWRRIITLQAQLMYKQREGRELSAGSPHLIQGDTWQESAAVFYIQVI